MAKTIFNLDIDKSQLLAVQSAVSGIKNGYETVVKNAINRTMSTVQTQAVARIANELNLSSTRIKQDFFIRNATIARLGGGVYATGKPVGLYSFGASETMSGIRVKVKKSSGADIIKHAFIAKTRHARKDGGVTEVMNVYWRSWNRFRKRWDIRRVYAKMPNLYRGIDSKPDNYLERKTGPRIEDIYSSDPVFDPITIQAQHLFVSRVDEEVTELFRKLEATGKI